MKGRFGASLFRVTAAALTRLSLWIEEMRSTRTAVLLLPPNSVVSPLCCSVATTFGVLPVCGATGKFLTPQAETADITTAKPASWPASFIVRRNRSVIVVTLGSAPVRVLAS